MQKAIENAVNEFLDRTIGKKITVISHHDTDGITSAAIMAKTLKRLDKNFTVKIVKGLEKENLEQIKPKNNEVLVFLDLGSSLLAELSIFQDVFVIDHHEITSNPTGNLVLVNPHLFDEEEISGAGLTYLFSKAIDPKNKDLANLAVIGMVGDMLDREISKLNNNIIEDAEVVIKKGLMLYPATRPIHKTLEFSSFYIPGVTGDSKGVYNLLKEIGIEKENETYKSLIELTDEELSKLLTAILLRTKVDSERIIGNVYLVKLFNKLEDARELSAMLNACSRLGCSNTALSLCLGNKKSVKDAEGIYAEYKQQLVQALKYADQNKIEGKGYVILNAQDKIKDTIIGTVASIMSMSKNYEEGTIIITMAYDNERVKASARVAGRVGKNVRELLQNSLVDIPAECGGHPMAAGCLFPKAQESLFLNNITKSLELQVIKI